MAAAGISSLMVEGGTQTVQSFLEAGLVDEIALFSGTVEVGADGLVSPISRNSVPSGFAPCANAPFGRRHARSLSQEVLTCLRALSRISARLRPVEQLPAGKSFRVKTAYDTATIDLGASIAHDGVCLTVVSKDAGTYVVEAWEEALRLTTAGSWTMGQRINLERALKVGDELGGHIVSGHVDAKAQIIEVKTGRRGDTPTQSRHRKTSPVSLRQRDQLRSTVRH